MNFSTSTPDIRYKLTSQARTTHNRFQLPDAGIWYSAANSNEPAKPCSNTVLHHYANPLLAVLFNPIHAAIPNPRLFKVEITEELGTDGLKGWCRSQRIVEEIELPIIYIEEKIAFAIYCAELSNKSPSWDGWAANWMTGTDRSYADAAAAAAADDAAAAATYAAYAAARAADAAADAAYAAADAAAYAAARAAYAARAAATPPDFLSIIRRVIGEVN